MLKQCFTICIAMMFAVSAIAFEPDPDTEIGDLIQAHFTAIENEDVEAYMATLHPDSPIYQPTRDNISQMFAQWDLNYEWEIIEIDEKSEDEATVTIVQTTRKVSGPEFRDNKITYENVLKKHDGSWLIWNSNTLDVEFLDQ